MKISKGEGAIVLIASLFVAFTMGWFLRGAGQAQPIRVETQRTLRADAAVIALPAPTGIGEKRAADIVADREKNGAYRFPEEIARIDGIGEETVAELLEYVTVGGGGA